MKLLSILFTGKRKWLFEEEHLIMDFQVKKQYKCFPFLKRLSKGFLAKQFNLLHHKEKIGKIKNETLPPVFVEKVEKMIE